MSARWKAGILGATNLVVIAFAFLVVALYAAMTDTRECGILECPWFVERRPQASQMFLAVLIHAMPVCILSGALTIACGLVAEIWSYEDSWINWSGPPRSTAHRDARSTDPTPTPSDTSHTTPSA